MALGVDIALKLVEGRLDGRLFLFERFELGNGAVDGSAELGEAFARTGKLTLFESNPDLSDSTPSHCVDSVRGSITH